MLSTIWSTLLILHHRQEVMKCVMRAKFLLLQRVKWKRAQQMQHTPKLAMVAALGFENTQTHTHEINVSATECKMIHLAPEKPVWMLANLHLQQRHVTTKGPQRQRAWDNVGSGDTNRAMKC
uniref:Uncharacterized protein n=1 Tax=Sphaerodactylus townsendi TaxID=933632 RepID=A0ACB8ET13_9SAUR